MATQPNSNTLTRRALKGERLTDFPIIDHHGHFELTQGLNRKEEVKMIVDEMDNCGVAQGVVFNIGKGDCIKINDSALDGISLFPDRFIGYAFVNLSNGTKNAVKELKRCRDRGMKGLKLHSGYCDEKDFFLSENFIDIWNFCAENEWPVIIHGALEDLPRKYPETVFIGAHHIGKIRDETAIEMFLECSNYYWCTSSTFCLKGAIEKIVSLGGVDKLLFGSDFPLNSLSARLGSILGAEIKDEEMKKILGGNVIRLLKLEEGN